MFSYADAMARTSGSDAQVTGPKLRDAATRLFARHGFAAVSMRKIAAEVGVQVGALYNYTPDKQTLLCDLMESHLQTLLEAFEDDVDADPLERLDNFIRFHLRFHRDRPDAVFIAYMELRNLTPQNFARIESLRTTYEDKLQAIIQAGQAQNTFDAGDSKIATLAVIAMLTGMTAWFRADGRLSFLEVEEQYIRLIRGALGVAAD